MIAGQLVARYFMRFQVAADLADIRRAEVVAGSVLPLVSDTAGAYARLGVVYLTQHKFAEAYEAARRAVAWNPRNQEALGLLFDAGMATGRYAVAESTLDRLTPGRLPYELRVAHLLTARGRLDGAYHAMDHACRQLARAEVRPQAVAWCLTELAKIQHAREGASSAPCGSSPVTGPRSRDLPIWPTAAATGLVPRALSSASRSMPIPTFTSASPRCTGRWASRLRRTIGNERSCVSRGRRGRRRCMLIRSRSGTRGGR